MAKRIVISSGPLRYGASRFQAALLELRSLQPGEALFVASERAADGAAGQDAVRALRASVKNLIGSKLIGLGLLALEDFDHRGVWVYRPAAWRPGRGHAIGPVKEAEVRARPIEP